MLVLWDVVQMITYPKLIYPNIKSSLVGARNPDFSVGSDFGSGYQESVFSLNPDCSSGIIPDTSAESSGGFVQMITYLEIPSPFWLTSHWERVA